MQHDRGGGGKVQKRLKYYDLMNEQPLIPSLVFDTEILGLLNKFRRGSSVTLVLISWSRL